MSFVWTVIVAYAFIEFVTNDGWHNGIKSFEVCPSNLNLFNLAEVHLVAGAVVEFGRPRRRMGGDLLGFFQRALVL